MPCLSLEEMRMIAGAEKECLDDMSSKIEQAINDAKQAAIAQNLDPQLIAKATVSMLLVTAASTAVINFQSLDQNVLALFFIRCATEAMESPVVPKSLSAH